MPHLIDTHSHLDHPIFEKDLEIVIRQAQKDDIWMVTVGSDFASSQKCLEIAEKHEHVYAAIGLHPSRVGEEELDQDRLQDLEKFSQLAQHPKVVAIGETGLDYYQLPDDSRRNRARIARLKENQKKVLGRFMQMSVEFRLPLLLHCREAHSDMLAMLERWDQTTRTPDIRGIVHHFSGNWKEAKRYFALDFMISATGLMTYGAYRTDVFRKAPLNRIVLESDCPHLTPVPWSQRRSEPVYLTTVAVGLAGLRQQSVSEISKQTVANALKVLTKLS